MNKTGSTYCLTAPDNMLTLMNRTHNETSSGQDFNGLLTLTDYGAGATRWANATGAPSSQALAMRYAVVTLFLTTFAFGTLGNTLTIYGLVRTKHLKNVANCFILNLAIADDLFLFSLPFTAHSTYVHRWVFGEALCKVMNVFRGVNLYASIFTMTLMSIDRYLAVVHPFDSLKYRTHRNALVVCTLNWAVCLVIMTPYWLYASTYPTATGGVMVKCQICWPTGTLNEHLWMWANFELVVGFILPILIMAICYALLLRCLVTDSQTPRVRRQGKTHVWRVTTMIFLVTVVFLVCWAPHHVLKLISAHKNRMLFVRGGQPGSSAFGFVVANIVAQGLTFVSSCCNPFIYYITSTNFRESSFILLHQLESK